MTKLVSKVRNAFGIRKHRRLQPRGPQPAVGCHIIKGDLRMEVQEGMSSDLWGWLLNLGWRKAMYKYDRRRYDDIPAEWVRELYRAAATERDRTLSSGTAAARGRGPLPAYRSQDVGWNAPDFDYLSGSNRAA